MKQPPGQINPLPGEAMLRLILDVVRNPEAVADTLAVIEEKRAEANEIVAAIGPAREIPKIKEAAEADRRQAAHELAQAKERAAAIEKAADEYAAEVKRELQAEAAKVEEQKVAAQSIIDAAASARAALVTEAEGLEAKDLLLREGQRELLAERDQVARVKRELDDRLAELKRVLAGYAAETEAK